MEKKLCVGDLLTDFVCIYKITAITPSSNDNRLIHYQPIKGTDKIFTDTIPENNLFKNGLRPLLSQKEIKSFLSELKSQTIPDNYFFDARQIKEDIYSNDPVKLISYLKYFYQKGDSIIKAERDFKEDIINHLCLEISFVTDKNPSIVKKTIESKLLEK